ncbi:MAG: single-stranded-DNA-specific exonuclease RecJ [Chloroflexi bacterium]|nr:single-stranded-DNA-specific exonuclease RecJ [Chloroflexota bacterium]
MILKEWRLRDAPPKGFARGLGLPEFQARLLFNRGIQDASDVESFLAADGRLLNDANLLPNMKEAVSRLKAALESSEMIGVFGDFDTDGITGTALLFRALSDLGATVLPYIPDRVEEGHGLNDDAVRLLKSKGVSLLITVDCGATSVDEVRLAASIGIDTIITDHHSMLPVWPEAVAIINPQHPDSEYPDTNLTGVGMSFKLMEALYKELGRPWPEHLLELVALGTVADVGPLRGENRFLVKQGLVQLNATQSPGLLALAESAGLKMGALNTESLSFGLIPRLNGAGRLGRADVSLDLLTATSKVDASRLAEELNRTNRERQALTSRSVEQALSQLEGKFESGSPPPIIIVKSEEWIPGILGLIANRLSEEYYRPAVAISCGPELSRASARSIPEFNVIEALASSEDLFTRYGGHHQAAGFTVPTRSLPAVEQNLYEEARKRLEGLDLRPSLSIDSQVALADFTHENFAFIQSLEPFGAQNPTPVFLTRRARVVESRLVGAQKQHIKMRAWHEGKTVDAIAFRQGDKIGETRGEVDLVYTVGLDTWGGRTKLQLTVLDIRKSGA